MSNRIDTLEATLAVLKRLEKKGVRSVYLDGVEIPNGAASAAAAAPPVRAMAVPVTAPVAPVAASAETVAGLADLA